MRRGAPESCGVRPGAVADFLQMLADTGRQLDSFMLYRRGRVVVEGWWWPHRATALHTLHSATKSITGTAVGFALAEGLLSLDDRVVSFFAGELPARPGAHLAAMRVEDLLTMRTGHATGISGATSRLLDTGWVAQFIEQPVPYPPGERFTYSSATSHMLSAIVQKVSGQPLLAYLTPRLFAPLGIRDVSWDTDPLGVCAGGNGLSLTTEDFLKFGVLHLQNGLWRGRQVLPPSWVSRATHPHVDHAAAGAWDGQGFAGDDSGQSPAERYGYHLWLGAGRSYHAGGIFGQYCIVLPEYDTVVAMTGSIGRWRHRELPALIDEHLVPALVPGAGTPADVAGRRRLRQLLTAAAIPEPAPRSTRTPPPGTCWRYIVEPDADGAADIDWVELEFAGDSCTFRQHDRRGTHAVRCGLGGWIRSSTSITSALLHHSYESHDMAVLASGAWSSAARFDMTWYFLGTPFRDTVGCDIDGDTITVRRRVNVNTGPLDAPPVMGRRRREGPVPAEFDRPTGRP